MLAPDFSSNWIHQGFKVRDAGSYKNENLLRSLARRESGARSTYRLDRDIVRRIVLQKDNEFTEVWSTEAKAPFFESDQLFVDNFHSVYNVHGLNNKPYHQFKLDEDLANERIHDVLLCEAPLARIPTEHKGYRSSLMLLLDDSLVRCDIQTGEVLQRVFLSNTIKYRHLNWNDDGYNFIIKSTKVQSEETDSDPIGSMTFIDMAIFPLKVNVVATITRKIFGRHISDAMVTMGMLVAEGSRGSIQIYNWNDFTKKLKTMDLQLGEPCDGSPGIVGSSPLGVPKNVLITEPPPVLFDLQCRHQRMLIGGFPWQCMFTPSCARHCIIVMSMKTRNVSGRFAAVTEGQEPDKFYFHCDESGRIVHQTRSEIRILSLADVDGSLHQILNEDFVIGINAGAFMPEMLHSVEFEYDLNCIVVTVSKMTENGRQGFIHLYNNDTGVHAKTIALSRDWDANSHHTVSVEIDTIVHIEKTLDGRFFVRIFKLNRNLMDTPCSSGPPEAGAV